MRVTSLDSCSLVQATFQTMLSYVSFLGSVEVAHPPWPKSLKFWPSLLSCDMSWCDLMELMWNSPWSPVSQSVQSGLWQAKSCRGVWPCPEPPPVAGPRAGAGAELWGGCRQGQPRPARPAPLRCTSRQSWQHCPAAAVRLPQHPPPWLKAIFRQGCYWGGRGAAW